MKIAIINTLAYGSTGNIAKHICEIVEKRGDEAKFFCGNWGNIKANEKKEVFGFKIENKISGLLSQTFGIYNIYSYFGTVILIRKLKKFKPDIIHLHNLHLWVINIPMLMNYIKKYKIKIVWTLHDCWSFTGRCPHFLITGCDKWISGCSNCIYPKEQYPQSLFFDNSSKMWELKRKWFSNIDKMIIVTPSMWLSKMVKKSYLKNYKIKVINNGIDLNIFKPRRSNFRKRYGLEEKYLILGVAFDWGYRKGLDIFIELSEILSDNYKIVLVGTNEEIDKKISNKIISIHKTLNQIELSEIYSEADLFFNPTREDTFPTVNMESLACGTPVMTYMTGGSAEIIDEKTGIILKDENVKNIKNIIENYCQNKYISEYDCRDRASNFYNKNFCFHNYYNLYKELLSTK